MRFVPIVYLASDALSLLGNSIAAVALPVVVLQITGSALGAGVVAAVTAIPAILVGLFAGVVIDRINRRTASIAADLVSAAAVAALPLVDLLFGLSLGWFVVLGILGSLGDVPGMTAREALVPAIVRHGGLRAERLVGLRESIAAVAVLIGPAAAGTLIAVLGGVPALWITAATSFVAALITLLLPHRIGRVVDAAGHAAMPAATPWIQLREGWGVLFGSRFLVAVMTVGTITVTLVAGLQGLVLPVYFSLAGEPGMLGFVLSALAAGMLTGSIVYAIFGSRGRRRGWLVVGMVGAAIGFAVIAVLASVWVVLVGAFLVGLSSALYSGLMGVLMIERIPEEARGRVMGTQNAIAMAAPTLGIVGAALLTEFLSVQVAAIGLGAVWLVALGVGLFARSLRSLEPRPIEVVMGDAQ
jgi:MFS family permease